MSLTIASLPPDAASFITGVVSSGKYSSADDVVIAALRLLESQERSLADLRLKIDEGLEDLTRGDYLEIPNDASHRALFDRLKSEILQTARGA